MSLSTKLIVAGVASAFLAGVVWLGYKHYTGLQEQIRKLEVSNAQLVDRNALQGDAIAKQQGALDEWRKEQERLIAQMQELDKVSKEASKELGRLNEIFSKHNLGKLSTRKPGLIEKRLNSGTARASRMLECSTGKAASC